MKHHHHWFSWSFVALTCVFGGCTTPSTAPPPAAPPEASSPAPVASEVLPPAPAPAPSGDGAAGTQPGTATTMPPGARSPAGLGGMCGGIAGFACQKELYCAFPPEAMCGAADQTGTCQTRPPACTFDYTPVCGCDDKTYSNACAAASAGVSVAKKGECGAASSSASPPRAVPAAPKKLAEGQLCGTRGVPGDCADGLYCAYRSQCGEADSGGVCAKKTQMCTKIYKPVCGCDGKTYGSACTAAGAGMSVRSDGPCPGTP